MPDHRQRRAVLKAGQDVAGLLGSVIDQDNDVNESMEALTHRPPPSKSTQDSEPGWSFLSDYRMDTKPKPLKTIPKMSLLKNDKPGSKSSRKTTASPTRMEVPEMQIQSFKSSEWLIPERKTPVITQRMERFPTPPPINEPFSPTLPKSTKTVLLDATVLNHEKPVTQVSFALSEKDILPPKGTVFIPHKPKAVFGKASTGRLPEKIKDKGKPELSVVLTGKKVEQAKDTVMDPQPHSSHSRMHSRSSSESSFRSRSSSTASGDLQKVKLMENEDGYYTIQESIDKRTESEHRHHASRRKSVIADDLLNTSQSLRSRQASTRSITTSRSGSSKSSSRPTSGGYSKSNSYKTLAPFAIGDNFGEALMEENIFQTVEQVEDLMSKYSKLVELKERRLLGEDVDEEERALFAEKTESQEQVNDDTVLPSAPEDANMTLDPTQQAPPLLEPTLDKNISPDMANMLDLIKSAVAAGEPVLESTAVPLAKIDAPLQDSAVPLGNVDVSMVEADTSFALKDSTIVKPMDEFDYPESEEEEEQDMNLLGKAMIITSMQAILDNRKRKMAEKQVERISKAARTSLPAKDPSESVEKSLLNYYNEQIPTRKESTVSSIDNIMSASHYNHYHSHAKSCDVETATMVLESIEAERVASAPRTDETGDFSIQGQRASIKHVPVAAGSTALGMGWLPAPPRFSLPMKFYKHYTSIPNTPGDEQQVPEEDTMAIDESMEPIKEEEDDLNMQDLQVFTQRKRRSTIIKIEQPKPLIFEKKEWADTSTLYGADTFPFKPEHEPVQFQQHGGNTLPPIEPDEEELDSIIETEPTTVKKPRKKFVKKAESTDAESDATIDTNKPLTTSAKKTSKKTKKSKKGKKRSASVETKEDPDTTLPNGEQPETDDEFKPNVHFEGENSQSNLRLRPGTARLKLGRAMNPGERRASIIANVGPKVDPTPESETEKEVVAAVVKPKEKGESAFLRKIRDRKRAESSNASLASSTDDQSGLGSSNLCASGSLGSTSMSASMSKRPSMGTMTSQSSFTDTPDKSNGMSSVSVLESMNSSVSRLETPSNGKRPGSSGKDASKLAVDGPAFFEMIHDVKKRHISLNAIEISRYPTVNDPESMDSFIDGLGESETMTDEIERLTKMIDISSVPVPTHLRRRGACYARMGKYEDAMNDFNKAIKYDPFNMDAFWFRHQFHLRNGNMAAALKDLDSITDNNRQHFGAFQAKARIYQELGITKLAIVNFSQVIKLKPEDADGYLQRAQLFESENENVYANEDYKMVRQLDPKNEKAITNLALYRYLMCGVLDDPSFDRQLWEDAAHAFSKLLELTPENGQAYMYRGRCNAYMARWDEALRDLTMAIRMNPGEAKYFFYRGCLVKDRFVQKAIEDFSVAIMLDENMENTDAFYQRALLYYQLKKYDLAVIDYLSVIEMNPTKSVAHLNLGLLYMKYLNDYRSALDCFEKTIVHDPIQLRAYLCRGELYQIMYNRKVPLEALERRGSDLELMSEETKKANLVIYLQRAIRDYSKCIHLCPGNYLLYLYRGRLLLQLHMMSESAYDFLVAFELNSGIAQTFVQRALVLSFQKKHAQIIQEYSKLSTSEKQSDPAMHMLVAKSMLKCGDNEGALNVINYALQLSDNDPQAHLQKGICLENLKRYPQAIVSYTRAVELDSEYPKAFYRRGICRLRRGDEKGVGDLDRAVKLDPNYFEAHIARASYFHSRGLYAEAIEDCSKALKVEPSSIKAHLLRGTCKCELNQMPLAIADFSKAISLDKNSYFAFYNRAISYQMLKDYDNAIKDYSIVLLIAENSNAFRNRGLIYWKRGDAENALIDLQAARDHFPEDSHLSGLLAMCLQKVGRQEEAVAAYTEAIGKSHNMKEAYLGRGNIYAAANMDKEARRDYSKVLHMFPRCTEAHINVAYLFQKKQQYKKAWDTFNAVLALNPQSVHALEGRAVLLHKLGHYFSALIDISAALQIDSANAELLTNRGVIYLSLKDNASALRSFKLALEVDPTYALASFNAANLYYSHKRWEQALDYFNKTLNILHNDASALLNRGITRVMLKDFEGALSDFDTVIKLEPHLPQAYFNRAHLNQTLGRYEEAEQDYTKVIDLTPKDSVAFLKRGETQVDNRFNSCLDEENYLNLEML